MNEKENRITIRLISLLKLIENKNFKGIILTFTDGGGGEGAIPSSFFSLLFLL